MAGGTVEEDEDGVDCGGGVVEDSGEEEMELELELTIVLLEEETTVLDSEADASCAVELSDDDMMVKSEPLLIYVPKVLLAPESCL